ncbi:hypothetical protein [Actinoplanes sp. NBRC 103695]|uniref:hypothetical protein n=1 Tax=Actinoplanes sp. NBRC 103695 TaxID=3032202 RepID=UPI0024A51632|nr:hypothetical protein [Actinoplanes sp. NBRC 103695]GLY99833.1 hypothetical protein Acsp02_70860 [Actinoplanes sp. NBRC 103695]
MRPQEHQPSCAAAKRRALLEAGVDLSPVERPLHALAAQIAACCGVLPLKSYRLARGMRVQEAVDALHTSRRDEGLPPCRLSREQLTHFENATRPGEAYRDALCRFYRTGPVQLGWAVDYSPRETEPASGSAIRTRAGQTGTVDAWVNMSAGIPEEAIVQRREALRVLLSASSAPVLSPALLELLDHIRATTETILGSSTVSDVALDRWEQAAETHGYAFKTQAPLKVLEDVLVDFAELQSHAARRQPLDSQKRISRISAQLAGTAANILVDLGYHRDASAWFATAMTAATETRDRALTGWVQAREATVSLYHNRPPQIAIAIAAEAQARAGGTPCAGAALAAATEARAWARLGHADNAITALRSTDGIAARLSTAATANSIHGYPVQQLAFHREATLTLVGTVDDAAEAQKAALALYPSGEYVIPTLIRLDQAACTIRRGDHSSGYQESLHRLAEIPGQFRTALVISRARELADIPALSGQAAPAKQRRNYLEAVDGLVLAP